MIFCMVFLPPTNIKSRNHENVSLDQDELFKRSSPSTFSSICFLCFLCKLLCCTTKCYQNATLKTLSTMFLVFGWLFFLVYLFISIMYFELIS